MKYADHAYRSADDRLTLYARVYGGEGQPLLLMHGLTRNSGDFEALADHLAGQYQLIVPDQRGRGKSEYDPQPDHYNPAVYAADMFKLLDDLAIPTAGLIGTSMGGLIAMIMAATNPHRASGLILNDIGPDVEQSGLDRIQSYVGAGEPFEDWDAAAAHCKRINGDAFVGVDDSFWMQFARHTCTALPDGRIQPAYDPAISAGFSGDSANVAPADLWPVWDLLATIPVLSIRGAMSDILSARTVAEMQRRHPQDFTAVEIPGRGHAPMLDEPEALGAIHAFLASLES
ncbi:MAG: alpha/beta hydrolase [Sphingopyxis sp.]|nr:MAG: alpha/beta hydrolase [Sphingopyxis sp.]